MIVPEGVSGPNSGEKPGKSAESRGARENLGALWISLGWFGKEGKLKGERMVPKVTGPKGEKSSVGWVGKRSFGGKGGAI